MQNTCYFHMVHQLLFFNLRKLWYIALFPKIKQKNEIDEIQLTSMNIPQMTIMTKNMTATEREYPNIGAFNHLNIELF